VLDNDGLGFLKDYFNSSKLFSSSSFKASEVLALAEFSG
jgi:hypothetical protein